MTKKAVIVGINYVGTANELRGCVNDANNVEKLLTDVYKFDHITKLLNEKATTSAIISALRELVANAKPGDVLFFHYSGHGSQMYDGNGDETDRFDEIICPVDINWTDKVIKDDDLKAIFSTVPMGANLTVFLDCCNSGTGIDQAESFQPYGPGDARSINNPSARYMPPPQDIIDQFQAELLLPKPKTIAPRNVDQSSMLITGCQSYQTSADALIDGQWQGAATHALLSTLKVKNDTSYKQLVISMNDSMIREGYTQRPELNGMSGLHNEPFLAQFGAANEVAPEPVITYQPEEKSSTTKTIVVGVIVALLLLILFG